MTRVATAVLAAVVLCGLGYIAVTAGQLPAVVATHFGGGGAANGWMSRDGYVVFQLLLMLLLPLTLYGGTAWLPRRFERFVNIPHRDYWLAPPQREATIAWLRAFGAGIAIAAGVFVIGLHALILAANANAPARLDEPTFIALLVVFVTSILGAVIGLQIKFRRAP